MTAPNDAELVRLMRDPAFSGEVIALLTAMIAENTGEAPVVSALDCAAALVDTPERAAAAVLFIGAMWQAPLIELSIHWNFDIESYIQRCALAYASGVLG